MPSDKCQILHEVIWWNNISLSFEPFSLHVLVIHIRSSWILSFWVSKTFTASTVRLYITSPGQAMVSARWRHCHHHYRYCHRRCCRCYCCYCHCQYCCRCHFHTSLGSGLPLKYKKWQITTVELKKESAEVYLEYFWIFQSMAICCDINLQGRIWMMG